MTADATPVASQGLTIARTPGTIRPLFEVAFLAVCTLLVVAIPDPELFVSNNASIYLSEAVRLLSGNGPEILKEGTVARGPVLASLLAFAFAVTGPSVIIAFYVMKVLYVGVVLAVYLVARRFYDIRVAMVAVVLLLLSIRVYRVGTNIDTTGLMAIFVLCAILTTHRGLSGGGRPAFVASGILLGLAFLTKETSIVFAAPFVAAGAYGVAARNWQILRDSGWAGAALVASLIPWAAYVVLASGSLVPLAGHFNPQFQQQLSDRIGSEVGLTPGFVLGLPTYLAAAYRDYLATATVIAPLLVGAFMAHLAIAGARLRLGRPSDRRGWADLLLAGSVLLYLPIVLAAVAIGDSFRQGFLIYLFLFILLGKYLVAVFDWAVPRLRVRYPASRLAPAATIAAAAVLLAGVATVTVARTNAHREIPSYLSSYRDGPEIKGRYTAEHEEGARWMERHLPKSMTIVADGYLPEIVGFYTRQRFDFIQSFQPIASTAYQGRSPVVFLITPAQFRSETAVRRFVYVIDREAILSDLRQGSVFAFSGRVGFLDEFFSRAPWARRLYANDSFYVYEATAEPEPIQEAQRQVFIDEDFLDDVAWLSAEYPAEYRQMRSTLAGFGVAIDELAAEARRVRDTGL